MHANKEPILLVKSKPVRSIKSLRAVKFGTNWNAREEKKTRVRRIKRIILYEPRNQQNKSYLSQTPLSLLPRSVKISRSWELWPKPNFFLWILFPTVGFDLLRAHDFFDRWKSIMRKLKLFTCASALEIDAHSRVYITNWVNFILDNKSNYRAQPSLFIVQMNEE